MQPTAVLLTETGFKRLLESLDSDREIAGQKYERIQRKLVSFFEWRGCAAAEDLADKTIDRVTRRLIDHSRLPPARPKVRRSDCDAWINASSSLRRRRDP